MGRIEQERVHEVRNELGVTQQQRLISARCRSRLRAAGDHPFKARTSAIGDESRVQLNARWDLIPVADAKLYNHHVVGIQRIYCTRDPSLRHYVSPLRQKHVYEGLIEAKLRAGLVASKHCAHYMR